MKSKKDKSLPPIQGWTLKADTYSRERAAQIILSRPSVLNCVTEEVLYSILYDAFTAGKNSIERLRES